MRQLIKTYGSKKRLSSFVKNSIQSEAPSAIDKVKLWRKQNQLETNVEQHSQELIIVDVDCNENRNALSQGLPPKLSSNFSDPFENCDRKVILSAEFQEQRAENKGLVGELFNDLVTLDTFSSQRSSSSRLARVPELCQCVGHDSTNETKKRRKLTISQRKKSNKKKRIQNISSKPKDAQPRKLSKQSSLRPEYPSLPLCSLQHINAPKKI
jgi:hypothetical protein